MRRITTGLLLVLAAGAAGCATGTVNAGYVNLQLDGTLGYESNATRVAASVDIDQDLDQGDRIGAPYARVEAASTGMFGMGFYASGFLYDQTGTGTLTATFGDITAGSRVDTDFRIANLKAGFFFHFDIADVVFIRPGLAADVFLPDMTVTSQLIPGLAESIDDVGGVPLPMVQVGVDTGPVAAFVEVGYLPLDSSDVNLGDEYDIDTRTWDIEAMVRVRPTEYFEAFVGYRLFHIELEGTIEQDAVNVDLDLGGFMVGGGLYW